MKPKNSRTVRKHNCTNTCRGSYAIPIWYERIDSCAQNTAGCPNEHIIHCWSSSLNYATGRYETLAIEPRFRHWQIRFCSIHENEALQSKWRTFWKGVRVSHLTRNDFLTSTILVNARNSCEFIHFLTYFIDSKIVCLLSAASTFICSRRISRFSRSIFALKFSNNRMKLFLLQFQAWQNISLAKCMFVVTLWERTFLSILLQAFSFHFGAWVVLHTQLSLNKKP